MATELQQHAEGGNRNEIQASQGGLVPKELGFNVNPAELEAIYRKLSGNEYLHFPSLERLGQKGDEGEDLAPNTQPGAKLIGVNGDNLTKIGTGHDDLQTVLERIDDAITLADQEYQFDNRDGTLASDIKTPRRFFSQFTEEEAAVGEGGHEIVGYDKTGEEQYINPIDNSENWEITGAGWGFDQGDGKPVYTAGGGTITQSLSNLPPPGNRWFEIKYQLDGTSSSEDDPPELTSSFSGTQNIDLEIGGGQHTIYIKSTPIDPVEIGIIGGSAGFKITTLELREIIGGNIDVHGKITGGGDKGIRVDGKGNVDFDGGLKVRKKNANISSMNSNPDSASGVSFGDQVAGTLVITNGSGFRNYVRLDTTRCTPDSMVFFTIGHPNNPSSSPTRITVDGRLYNKTGGLGNLVWNGNNGFIIEVKFFQSQSDSSTPVIPILAQGVFDNAPLIISWLIIDADVDT